MTLRDLQTQLIRDMKRSWAKTALLGSLLVVGMVFWLPPLFKGTTSSPGRSASEAAAKPTATAAPSSTKAKSDAATRRGQPATEEFSWKKADEWMESDPAAQSAEMAQVRQNPFRLDRDQFPPPILFATEPPPVSERPSATAALAAVEPVTEIKGALLTSTLVSPTRRAALINDRLYNEGSQFKLEGQTFAVERILPDRVKLTQEGVVYYLTIPSRFEISQ
ncbi:MAG: hypothetical protein HZA46_23925 [Planctomycetales bacterium]|nr:hypothetical protein [Planctomycetales bacterium]